MKFFFIIHLGIVTEGISRLNFTYRIEHYINIICLLQMLTPQSRRNCLLKSCANVAWHSISWTQWLISKARKLNGVRSMNWWNISQQGEVSSLNPFTRKPLRWYVINESRQNVKKLSGRILKICLSYLFLLITSDLSSASYVHQFLIVQYIIF